MYIILLLLIIQNQERMKGLELFMCLGLLIMVSTFYVTPIQKSQEEVAQTVQSSQQIETNIGFQNDYINIAVKSIESVNIDQKKLDNYITLFGKGIDNCVTEHLLEGFEKNYGYGLSIFKIAKKKLQNHLMKAIYQHIPRSCAVLGIGCNLIQEPFIVNKQEIRLLNIVNAIINFNFTMVNEDNSSTNNTLIKQEIIALVANQIKRVFMSQVSKKINKAVLKKISGPVGIVLCGLNQAGAIELLNFIYKEIEIENKVVIIISEIAQKIIEYNNSNNIPETIRSKFALVQLNYKKLLDNITPLNALLVIQELARVMEDWQNIQVLSEKLVEIYKMLRQWREQLKFLEELKDSVDEDMKIVDAKLKVYKESIKESMKDLKVPESLKNLSEKVEQWRTIEIKNMNEIKNQLSQMEKRLNEINNIFGSIERFAGDVGNFFNQLGGSINNGVNQAVEETVNVANIVVQGTVNAANTVAQGTVNVAHTVVQGTVNAANTVAQGTVNVANKVAQGTVSTAETIGNTATEAAKTVGNFFGGLFH